MDDISSAQHLLLLFGKAEACSSPVGVSLATWRHLVLGGLDLPVFHLVHHRFYIFRICHVGRHFLLLASHIVLIVSHLLLLRVEVILHFAINVFKA